MRLRILALGTKNVNRRVAHSLTGTGIDMICHTNTDEAITQLKQEKFDLALIDGNLEDLESICYRINWLGHTPIALVINGVSADWSSLHKLDVDGFIPEEAANVEMIAYFQAIVRRSSNQTKKIKLLVIEDDEYTREALRLSFEIYWPEAEASFASTGENGISMARRNRLDVILLDLNLPDLPGLDVLKSIRSINQAPVIVLSADRNKQDIVSSILLGASDYVLKPYRQLELMTRIRSQVNSTYTIHINNN